MEHLGRLTPHVFHFTWHFLEQPGIAETHLGLRSQMGLGVTARPATNKERERGDITDPPCVSVSPCPKLRHYHLLCKITGD